jgi:hypothetical protein
MLVRGRHWIRVSVLLNVMALMAGCAHVDSTSPGKAGPVKQVATVSMPSMPPALNEFMAHVMQYSADNVWGKQGWIIDRDGVRSLFPKNEQEWEDAESASLTLAQVSRILLQPDRRMDGAAWESAEESVYRSALNALKAAENRDAIAFMSAGTEIDEACDNCHRRYMPNFK